MPRPTTLTLTLLTTADRHIKPHLRTRTAQPAAEVGHRHLQGRAAQQRVGTGQGGGRQAVLQAGERRQRGHRAGEVARRSAVRLQQRPVPADVDDDILTRLEQELEGLDQ